MTVQMDQVRDWVRTDFGVELVSVDPVNLGSDNAASLWRGLAVDGTAYAVKWTSGGSVAGARVAAHLARLGVAVVAPLPTANGDPWSDRGGRRLLLTPWLTGDRAVERRMDQRQWESFGSTLARIHSVPSPAALSNTLPQEDFTHSKIDTATHQVDHQLSNVGPEGDELVWELAKEWHVSLGDQILTLLDHADDLASRLRGAPLERVLCHGDPHLGNVVLVDGTPWLLDWDDAMLAPPERDLVLLKGGMGAYGPMGSDEQAWFDTGYRAPDADPVRLAYYRCTRALEDVVYFAEDVLDLERAPSDRAELLEIIRGVAGPTGLRHYAMLSLRELDRFAGDSHWR